LAESFRAEGYDGIAYKSLLSENGFNLALFDLDGARVHRSKLVSIKAVQFKSEDLDGVIS
jgi:hypothetical protein